MKYIYTLSVGLMLVACKTKQIVPKSEMTFSPYQKISLDYGDSLVNFYIADANEVKPELARSYTWFNKDTIVTTQGQFSGKLLHGEYEMVNQSNKGLMQKGTYDQGLKDGQWITWHPNGMIKSAHTYKSGVLKGEYILQDRAGKPIRKGAYNNDLLDGVTTYYQADTVLFNIKYQKGVPTDTLP